ncbi:hypothetical protein [Nocardia sp. NPDC052566]|uniref:hypothetical protein n=1 Tax=Nocardia sp. NPDC052566 TaxID=3364330 RepID=UPI0037C687DC
MKTLLKMAMWGIVAVGVYRGYVNYSGASGADAATVGLRLVSAVVNAIADLTYRWIPIVAHAVGALIGYDGTASSLTVHCVWATPW